MCSSRDAVDPDLLLAMAGGDRDSLATLYERYAPLLLAVALRMLGDAREAEDVVQDVFLEAWRAAASYDPNRAPVRTWLLMRLRSRVLDRKKACGVTRRVPLAPEHFERLHFHEDPSVAADRAAVRAALGSLPPEYRMVIELAWYDGLSSSEIAERSRTPIGTVKSRTAAALARLRGSLARGGLEQ